jgi:DNA invertase Pin-like site-specific DNA recombinase
VADAVLSVRDLLSVMYVRMSTEHQQYSTQHQETAIRRYAEAENLQITKIYIDSGKSGLTLAGRPALSELLRDVQSGTPAFGNILVYDVSRWGRFQDADESAYYEHLCKRARVFVHYCEEQFKNDGSFSSTLLKTIKRSMAGEYSRELSIKVFAGQSLMIKKGFRLGGLPGYGLRRQLQDKNGNIKMALELHERKSIQTDRVILIPGPPDEVAVISEIYSSFIAGKGETSIAAGLNARGVPNGYGRPWSNGSIHEILSNQKYIGINIFNKKSFKLKQKRVKNPFTEWIRHENAFSSIVSVEDFASVQQIFARRNNGLSQKEMLSRLRDLLKRRGRISYRLIDAAEDLPSGATCARHFGGLRRAYEKIGYSGEHDFSFVAVNQKIEKLRRTLIEATVSELRSRGAHVLTEPKHGLITVNREFTVSVLVVRCFERGDMGLLWKMTSKPQQAPDISIIARMCIGNESILDYFVFPHAEGFKLRIRFRQFNTLNLEAYRFNNLDSFLDICQRKRIRGGR